MRQSFSLSTFSTACTILPGMCQLITKPVHLRMCRVLVTRGCHTPLGLGAGCLEQRLCLLGRQAALEVTARHCRKETEQYGQCVAANPSTWQQDCHQLKLDMAKCTSSHPIVQKIRSDCAEPFAAFEQCLKQNQTSVMNCREHVQQFLLCADQVKLAT